MEDTVNELSLLAKAIYSLMVTDPGYVAKAGKRFYEELVPEEGRLPCGIFIYQGGRDIIGAFGQRLATNGVYQIKGLCNGNSFGPLEGLSNDIDRLLCSVNQYRYEFGSEAIVIPGIRRVDPLKYVRVVEGVRENHMGGLYRIIAYRE
jgi:hypothetical protein